MKNNNAQAVIFFFLLTGQYLSTLLQVKKTNNKNPPVNGSVSAVAFAQEYLTIRLQRQPSHRELSALKR